MSHTVFTLINAPGVDIYFSDYTLNFSDYTLNFSDFTLKTQFSTKFVFLMMKKYILSI